MLGLHGHLVNNSEASEDSSLVGTSRVAHLESSFQDTYSNEVPGALKNSRLFIEWLQVKHTSTMCSQYGKEVLYPVILPLVASQTRRHKGWISCRQ